MRKFTLNYIRDREEGELPHYLFLYLNEKPVGVSTILNWTTLRILIASDISELAQKLIPNTSENFEHIKSTNYFKFRHKSDAMLIKMSLDIDKYV